MTDRGTCQSIVNPAARHPRWRPSRRETRGPPARSRTGSERRCVRQEEWVFGELTQGEGAGEEDALDEADAGAERRRQAGFGFDAFGDYARSDAPPELGDTGEDGEPVGISLDLVDEVP